ncbi:MAG: type I restriction enzyme endonuclease domain-containing protein [Candidatus Contendobacter sp.]
MNAHAYSEDQIVEQPAIGLFAHIGWQTVSALDETFGPGGALGRETKGEVVLAQRFKESKHKNTDLEALKAAIRARLEQMIRLNRTRADFAEKFEALIERYNAGSNQKCLAVFEHVYESYPERNAGVYAMAV